MEHIYECRYLNENTVEITFEEIFGDNIKSQIKYWNALKVV